METEDLLFLLEQCRRGNEQRGITGVLLYRDRAFMQVIEGEERNFAKWSMGFRHLGDLLPDELQGFSEFMMEEIEASDFEANTFGQQMLLSFRQIRV